jgi:hypothetical protein
MFVARRIGGLEMSIVYLQYFRRTGGSEMIIVYLQYFRRIGGYEPSVRAVFFYTKKPPAHSRGLFY